MACTKDCVCSCGQIGCGCNDATAPVQRDNWPTCTLCGEKVKAFIYVVGLTKTKHLLKFCPVCDVRRCAGRNGCGHHEQNPHAMACSKCGVTFK